ncbi:MAG: tyrosine-type recombinase/integrase [Xenococcaceae cyanobacterium]
MIQLFREWRRTRDISEATKICDKSVYLVLTGILEEAHELIMDELYKQLVAKYKPSTLGCYLRKSVRPFIAYLKNTKRLDVDYELPIEKVYGKQIIKRAPIRTITNDEVSQVHSLLDEIDQVAVEILLDTGLRPSELLAIDPSDINDDTVTISKSRVKGFTRNQTKTKRDRTIKVSAKTANLLQQCAGKFNDDFTVKFTRACREVGLAERVGSYALRRTTITNAVKNGHSFTKLGYYFGNSPIVLERHYINTSVLVHSI